MIGEETEEIVELEKIKLQNMALAIHPATQTDYLKSLFPDETDDAIPEEFENENIDIEWRTPSSEEELEELSKILEGV